MLISSGNKEIISNSMVNGITFNPGIDPMTKQQDDPKENLTLIKEVPTSMGAYKVTYTGDSLGHEKGRRFYQLNFDKKDKNNKTTESFVLQPDVYLMKDNNMSSNPDTKSYLNRDVFTYISYALSDEQHNDSDTTQFKTVQLHEGDTAFYSNGYIILNKVQKNPNNKQYQYKETDLALMADVTVVSKDSMRYSAYPLVEVDSFGIINRDDTVFAQNLYLRFQGVAENHHIKLGIKESDKLVNFVTVKAYVFPYIQLVWLHISNWYGSVLLLCA